jgi:pimeloyl-ACP methyl ester carboxylesterase
MTVLITLHGGCFTGGSATWDAVQTRFLKDLGYDVHQLEFPKDNLNNTIAWIVDYIRKVKETHNIVNLLGRSSGGYLAKVIHDTYPRLVHKVIYLAPVFSPQHRAIKHPKFKMQQDLYFKKDIVPSTATFDPLTELLFLASNDENVPDSCFTKEQLHNAIYLGIKTHKGLLGTVSCAFKDILVCWLNTT